MLDAIGKEIAMEKEYLEGEELKIIYFGGGTPSVLEAGELKNLLGVIFNNYNVSGEAEITLEANPDDLSPEYLSSLLEIGINRLSIGIQSFDDDDLILMNRRHNSSQSRKCIENARKAGFENLSIDLIYGMPGMNKKKWSNILDTAIHYNPSHIAAYHLTYEQGTVLEYRKRKQTVIPIMEIHSTEQFSVLTDKMEKSGYQHYEISNFALPGRLSKHNSAYWKGEKYLGVGPSAHSYNGISRRWNLPRNTSYIKEIGRGGRIFEEEILGEREHFHDYLMTSLRTMWGLDMEFVRKSWGEKYYKHLLKQSDPFIKTKKIRKRENKLILTSKGMFIADHIIRELFI